MKGEDGGGGGGGGGGNWKGKHDSDCDAEISETHCYGGRECTYYVFFAMGDINFMLSTL